MNLQSSYIVIHNYMPNSIQLFNVPFLSLWIGERIKVIAEHGSWCYGHYKNDISCIGLFPKLYIKEVFQNKKTTCNFTEAQQLINEITEAVKLWWRCVKTHYRDNSCDSESSEKFIKFIKDLMIIRNKLQSGNVPTGELKEIRLLIARKIDIGNHCMDLNMHIRNELGKVIRAEELSVTNAYKEHELSFAKLSTNSVENTKMDKISILISINSSTEIKNYLYDAEFLIYLKNLKTGEIITETLTLKWLRSTKKFAHDFCRGLFVDLTAKELRDGNLLLIVKMLKLAPLEIMPVTPKKKNSIHRNELNNSLIMPLSDLRQLYACGEVNLSDVLRDINNKEKREVLLNLIKSSVNQTSAFALSHGSALLSSSKPFPLFFSDKQINQQLSANKPFSSSNSFDYKIPFTVNVQLIADSLESIQDHNIDIFFSTNPPPPAILQKIYPTNIKLSFDFRRNEAYIYFKSADLRIGKSSSSCNSAFYKNFETVLSLWNEDGTQIKKSFEIITSDRVIHADCFYLSVTAREERPFFDETIKIILPDYAVKGLHLRILFYNRRSNCVDKNSNSNEITKKFSTPIALSFLILIQNYVLLPESKLTLYNEDIDLYVYKIDPNKFDEKSIGYLRLSSKRQDITSLKNGNNFSVSQSRLSETSYGAFTLAEKGILTLRNFVVSVFHTRSVCLLHVLRWKQIGATNSILNERIREVIDSCVNYNSNILDEFNELQTDELLKFLPSFLDALFQIAADERMIFDSQITIFDAVIYVIRLCNEPKNLNFSNVLADYVEKFYSPSAYKFLLKNLIWYIENESKNCHNQNQNVSTRDSLLPVLKSLGILTQLIVVSKYSFNFLGFNKNNDETNNDLFLTQINLLLETIANIVRSNSSARMTCQNAALKYFPSMIAPLIRYEIYKPIKLAHFILSLIDDLSNYIVIHQKLAFIGEIIETDLFETKECRKLLMPKFLEELLFFMCPQFWSFPLGKNSIPSVLIDRTNSISGIEFHLRRQLSIDTYVAHAQSNDTIGCFVDLIEIVELSAKILTNLVEKLFPYSRSKSVIQCGTADELKLILFKLLRPVNRTAIVLLNDPSHQRPIHNLLLSLLDKFSSENFLEYFKTLQTSIDRLDMLSELLHMFRDLLLRSVLPIEWYQMRHLQHKIFIKHLRFSYALITQQFSGKIVLNFNEKKFNTSNKQNDLNLSLYDNWKNKFIPEIWLECMLTAVAIIKSLMTVITNSFCNNFKDTECGSFNASYEQSNHDMCSIAATTLRSLWFSMGSAQKMLLWPKIIGAILEVALYEDESLREITIPIFYDMLEIEHFYLVNGNESKLAAYRNSQHLTQNFILAEYHQNIFGLNKDSKSFNNIINDNCISLKNTNFRNSNSTETSNSLQSTQQRFTDEFIMQLDPLIDSNRGSEKFRIKFHEMFMDRCISSSKLQNSYELGVNFSIQFVEKVDKLLELLLNYRQVRFNSDCIENGMFCTVQLIDFYQKIGENALYINYLYKLYDLHVMSGNCVEAALTLKKHANLLKWNNDKLESYMIIKLTHRRCETHMADLFDRGEHWEQAVEVLKELIPVYENILFDFVELSSLLQRLSVLYNKITSTIRMENNYFLVNFYGLQAPPYLAGQKFVFCGEKLEQWNSFKQRMLHNYYDFKFIENVDNCEDKYANASGKFIQIIPISAQPSATYTLLNKSPHRLACWYYKHNQVQRFEQIRPEMRSDTKWTKLDINDVTKLWIKRRFISIAKPLPDILKFAPVVSELEPDAENPVDVAVFKIEEVNEQLIETAQLVAAGFVQFLVNLGGLVRGVVQADVGGGIRNYEPFFTDECWNDANEQERKSISLLKNILREHVMILEYALYVHASKHSQINYVFHNSLVELFEGYRRNIEERFGKVKSILPLGASIHLEKFPINTGVITGSALNLNLTNITNNSTSALDSNNANLSSLQSPLHHNSNSVVVLNSDSFNLLINDASDSGIKHTSLPLASNSNLNTGQSSASTNVLFRHVPTAATLLRNTMHRSRALTNANNLASSPIHVHSSLKKNNLRKITNTVSHDFDDDIVTLNINLEQQQKEQNLAMISALREVAASRFSSDSVNVDDLIIATASDTGSIKTILPSLPPRFSDAHSTDFLH